MLNPASTMLRLPHLPSCRYVESSCSLKFASVGLASPCRWRMLFNKQCLLRFLYCRLPSGEICGRFCHVLTSLSLLKHVLPLSSVHLSLPPYLVTFFPFSLHSSLPPSVKISVGRSVHPSIRLSLPPSSPQMFFFIDWVKHQLVDPKLFQTFLRVTLVTTGIVGGVGLAVGMATGEWFRVEWHLVASGAAGM